MQQFGFRQGKILFVLVLVVCFSSRLIFPSITLNIADTRVLFEIEVPDASAVSNQRVAVCELSLLAKQKAPGTVSILHTPLTDGLKTISYSLAFEDRGTLRPLVKESVPYVASTDTLESVLLAKLWAELKEPLEGNAGNYASDVAFNLILEQ
jgi:hypothetical protein